MNKIYVQRKGAMGDVLLTTPIVKHLRNTNKNSHVVFMTNTPEVYNNNPYVDEIIKPTSNIDGKLIDLDLVYEKSPKEYIVDAYAKYAFGTTNIDKTIELFETKEDKKKIDALLVDEKISKYIVVHMATSWANRTMSLEDWKIIINKLILKGYHIVIVGRKGDLDYSGHNIHSLKDKLSLHEIKCLIAKSDGFVGMDSGLLHVATTTDVPIVGVFTCAKAEYRMPQKDNVFIVKTSLDCYGCLHEQTPPVTFVECKYGHNNCVKTIDHNEIDKYFPSIKIDSKYKFDIVIPSWNMSHVAIPCLESIKKHSKDYRVIFVDNGSEKEELSKIVKVLNTMPHLLIRNEENLGFIKATNLGLKASDAPYVVLMNNDTEAVSGWLEKLVEPLEKESKCGLSGPLTTTPNSWQGKYEKGHSGYVIREKGMLAFFCTMIRRDVIDNVGYLDEDFGVGFADDDDYCRRARLEGYILALVQDLVIPHHHRTTFKEIYGEEKIPEMQRNAISKFLGKYAAKKVEAEKKERRRPKSKR